MAVWLKGARTAEERAQADRQVRETVEATLADIERRGDEAVRELSVKFDGWDREDYRLTQSEIDACIGSLSRQDIHDIEFAQQQVRTFAQIQRDALKNVEVETLPGVVLGHRNIPVNAAGCYVPGGKYPLLASAHMSVITAKVAGVKRVITCAPPFEGKPAPAIVAAQAMADPDYLDQLRRLAGLAHYVTSVCTGSLLLGAAGLLRGRRAACHWAWRDQLALFGATPDPARVVRDGDVFTGGGVTAGIDFALTIVAEIAGADTAQAIQLAVEYAPDPPFHAGRPETAPPAVLERITALYGKGMDERWAAARTAAEALTVGAQ
mgnify:CR=1 FL=1